MKAFKKRQAVYADLEALPESMVGELVDGELVASPRPALPHSNAAGEVTSALRGPFHHGDDGGPGGWWLLPEPELHLGADVLVPDVAGWRRERLPKLPNAAFCEVPPDWVCEVLSPSTAGFDRVKKMPLYLREGVGHVWLVDPGTRTVEVFRRAESHWLLVGSFASDPRARLEPFEAFEFNLQRLWVDDEGA